MAVDAKNVASGRGRDSVRISSKDRFNDEHHWPNGGEIDILEGANGLPAENSTAWSATANLKSPSSGFPPNADTS
ncbi:hypothetical protein QFC21_005142 [Naganishia friedmannii]|uniref:Uncharacterized protein n=1 Tax=Naganishia friedmannii TaxID=89922 RepID=A0ACC2VAL1_9TREE|nr:hypothetical protein QFC21_005142 [Naganishia friedmannii]